jgi:tRNA-2-methylthio-N6-dimethylallyladenosine synthase
MYKQISKKYHISSFGCQMNYADAERFSAIIESLGYTETQETGEADLIILNTCSIRQKAEDRILGLSRNMQILKTANPDLKIILTGCMARRSWLDHYQTVKSPLQMSRQERESNLKKEMPWLDFVLESSEFYKLPEMLGYEIKNKLSDYFSYAPKSRNNYQAWIPISMGCDHFCSYCIVPFARGREICRPFPDMYSETRNLISEGFKDVTLLGQTVNRWVNPEFDMELKKGRIGNTVIPELNKVLLTGIEIKKITENIISGSPDKNLEPVDFLQLLQIIDGIEGNYWLNFMSSHPNYLTDELIEFMAKSRHIKPYVHFAMQSGSDNILKKMNRKYFISEFISKTQKLKSSIPNLGLSTDIIVGFPGETEADFIETAKVMELLEFDMAYISEYSPRKGTASALIKEDVNEAEKTRRKKYLNDEVLAKSALKFNKKMINTIQKVLIEKKNKAGFLGRTENNKEILITNPREIPVIGTFVAVKVKDCTPWALNGELFENE